MRPSPRTSASAGTHRRTRISPRSETIRASRARTLERPRPARTRLLARRHVRRRQDDGGPSTGSPPRPASLLLRRAAVRAREPSAAGNADVDEIWVDTTPEALADWFEDRCRERFPLVLADVLGLRDDAPVLVDGPQALPELVAPVIPAPGHVLYVVASRAMQEPLVRGRGSGVASQVRDPERAVENRLGRDEELVQRLRADAAKHGLPLVDV